MLGLSICVITVVTLICTGYIMARKGYKGGKTFYLVCVGVSAFLIFSGAILSLLTHPALAATEVSSVTPGAGMGFLAAALSTSCACIGAGIAVGTVGSAALGLIGEKPEMLGTTLIYLGLAEGIAIYGIIVSLLIVGKL